MNLLQVSECHKIVLHSAKKWKSKWVANHFIIGIKSMAYLSLYFKLKISEFM